MATTGSANPVRISFICCCSVARRRARTSAAVRAFSASISRSPWESRWSRKRLNTSSQLQLRRKEGNNSGRTSLLANWCGSNSQIRRMYRCTERSERLVRQANDPTAIAASAIATPSNPIRSGQLPLWTPRSATQATAKPVVRTTAIKLYALLLLKLKFICVPPGALATACCSAGA